MVRQRAFLILTSLSLLLKTYFTFCPDGWVSPLHEERLGEMKYTKYCSIFGKRIWSYSSETVKVFMQRRIYHKDLNPIQEQVAILA